MLAAAEKLVQGYTTIAEGRESYKLDTYGRIFGVNRQAIVNDNLSAFSDIGRLFAEFPAEVETILLRAVFNLFLATLLGAAPLGAHQELFLARDLERLYTFGDREIVILASIVEKETGSAADRARIAGVFVNDQYMGGRQSVLVPWDLDVTEAVRDLNHSLAAVARHIDAIAARTDSGT